MAGKGLPTLTDAELQLMNVLWDNGSGTVIDVVKALPADKPLGYSSVTTSLRALESKGYARHEKRGAARIYFPAVNRARLIKMTLALWYA